MTGSALPLIGVPACRRTFHAFPVHFAGEKYLSAVTAGAGGLPFVVPALEPMLGAGTGDALRALVDRMDGLLLTGSPSNIEPHHYGGTAGDEDEPRDAWRDRTNLPLIRLALDTGVPLLAICRGVQELNVALGGTLHQAVHRLPGVMDHRSDKLVSDAERYGLRHRVAVRADGRLAAITGSTEAWVNSLHMQAIDRPAERLRVEAVAEDGVIEAVSVVDAPDFAIGVQWHPEWEHEAHPFYGRLLKAFGDAARRRMATRGHDFAGADPQAAAE